MIESLGGIVPFLGHAFLIFFAGFFSLNFIFNKNFTKSFGFESQETAKVMRNIHSDDNQISKLVKKLTN